MPIAPTATRALAARRGCTTPRRPTREERVRTPDEAGYARYDDRNLTMLGEPAQLLLGRYGPDLRTTYLTGDTGMLEDVVRIYRS